MDKQKNADDICGKFAVDLSAYHDNELEGKERDAMKRHLDGCGSCRRDLEKMTKISSAMNSLNQPADLELRLLEDLKKTLKLPEEQENGGSEVLTS